MFSNETHLRVRYSEVDQMGVVYHSNYFPYLETARAESIRQLGITYADLEKLGIIMPVASVNFRFLQPAKYDDLLTIKTILKELPIHYKIEFQHEVYNEQQVLLASGKIILYFLTANDMKPTTMPEQLFKKLQPFFS